MVEFLRNLVSRIEIMPNWEALLTPLIAILATYIAYQQWNTNRLSLKLEMYERRLRVYQEVVKILHLISRDFDPKLDDLMEFRVAVAEADFLFGPDIAQYIREIFSCGLRLNQARFNGEKIPSEEKWLTEQLSIVQGRLVVAEQFRPYLDISK